MADANPLNEHSRMDRAKKEKKKALAAAKAEAEAAEAEAVKAAEAAKGAEAAQGACVVAWLFRQLDGCNELTCGSRLPLRTITTASMDPAKKKKALEKKLKQIDELKKRASGGEALNADQKEKLATEEEIRQQLAALGL